MRGRELRGNGTLQIDYVVRESASCTATIFTATRAAERGGVGRQSEPYVCGRRFADATGKMA